MGPKRTRRPKFHDRDLLISCGRDLGRGTTRHGAMGDALPVVHLGWFPRQLASAVPTGAAVTEKGGARRVGYAVCDRRRVISRTP